MKFRVYGTVLVTVETIIDLPENYEELLEEGELYEEDIYYRAEKELDLCSVAGNGGFDKLLAVSYLSSIQYNDDGNPVEWRIEDMEKVD